MLLIFIGAIFQRVDMFVDFALTYALLNFIGTLAATKYFHHSGVVDGPNEGPSFDKIHAALHDAEDE